MIQLGASKRYYTNCVELAPLGVFRINLATEHIQLNPWQSLNDIHMEQLSELQEILNKEIEIKSTISSPWLVKEIMEDSSRCYDFESILKESIRNSSTDIFGQLLNNNSVVSVCDETIIRLEKSVSDRISATPALCKECMKLKFTKCDHARIGILFSGGIDCTILAVLTDKLVDSSQPIDLINVSFEKINRSKSKIAIDYNTPDRISAKESLEELKRMNPKR